MIINLSNYQVCRGAFAVVLINKGTKTAIKLFKSYDHPQLNGTGKQEIGEFKTHEYHTKVFETEIKAYELVQQSELLKKYTPQYYGTTSVVKITENGNDITHQFLKNCCFSIEFIDGYEKKVSLIRNDTALLNYLENNLGLNLAEIIKEFNRLGINYLTDSTAIFNDNEFKIIDFGTIDSVDFQPIINS